jgi:hypothetical protein
LIAATQGRGAWSIAIPDAADLDGDTIQDTNDNCPSVPNPLQEDDDADGVGTACDNCPLDQNAGQVDADSDGFGAACDCDDANGAVNPSVPEDCANGIDDDCNGMPDPWDLACGVDLLRNDALVVVDGGTFGLMRGILRASGPPALDPVADLFRPGITLPLDILDDAPAAAPPPHRGSFVFYELSGDRGVTIFVDLLDADADGARDDVRIRE